MGFYRQRVVPHLLDKAGGMKALRPLRERVCAGLSGDVIELGFGAGLNVAFYPAAVMSVSREPFISPEVCRDRLRATVILIHRARRFGPDAAVSTPASTPRCRLTMHGAGCPVRIGKLHLVLAGRGGCISWNTAGAGRASAPLQRHSIWSSAGCPPVVHFQADPAADRPPASKSSRWTCSRGRVARKRWRVTPLASAAAA
jgi:hypothetical protein